MPTSVEPAYLLIEDGRATGPHSLAVLHQKAEIHVINATTLVAFTTEPDQWRTLREIPALHAALFPPKAKLSLGSRQIERVNENTIPPPPDIRSLLRINRDHEREAENPLLKPLRPRINKRRRDYLALAGLLNGGLAAAAVVAHSVTHPLLVGIFLVGNSALAGVLFFVMDPY